MLTNDSHAADRPVADYSVVVPTFRRPNDIPELLKTLAGQSVLPQEVLIVDGSPEDDNRTQEFISAHVNDYPFEIRYIRFSGGPGPQRNRGLDEAKGKYVLLVDDDIRLEKDFIKVVYDKFEQDIKEEIGGITGYITNQFLNPETSRRWKLYRKFRVFSTFEPGRYDFRTGYPINRYLRPPHEDFVEIDFCGAGLVTWRRSAIKDIRFDPFFLGYSILEDAHFALRVSRKYKLLEAGAARCQHLHSPGGRPNVRRLAYMTAVNFKYLFNSVAPERSFAQNFNFYKVQTIQLFGYLADFIKKPNGRNADMISGKIAGIVKSLFM